MVPFQKFSKTQEQVNEERKIKATSDDRLIQRLLWFLNLPDETNWIESNGLCDLQKLDEV